MTTEPTAYHLPADFDRTTDFHPAEILKLEAEAAQADQLRLKQAAETRRVTAEAIVQEVYAETKREDRSRSDVSDVNARRLVFDDSVTAESVAYAIAHLTQWARLSTEPIEIVVNSPGGSITDGFALVDFIRSLRASGIEVNITALGMAASMGGVLLQAATTRRIGKHSVLLIHEGSMGAIGDVGAVEDRLGFIKNVLHPKILSLFADRAAEAAANGTATEPLDADEIKVRWDRKDWWLNAEDSLRYGFVDEIV